jgi:hypothetical protein
MNTHTFNPNLKSSCPKAHLQGRKKIPPSLYREGGVTQPSLSYEHHHITLSPQGQNPLPYPREGVRGTMIDLCHYHHNTQGTQTRSIKHGGFTTPRNNCSLLYTKEGASEIGIPLLTITMISLILLT